MNKIFTPNVDYSCDGTAEKKSDVKPPFTSFDMTTKSGVITWVVLICIVIVLVIVITAIMVVLTTHKKPRSGIAHGGPAELSPA